MWENVSKVIQKSFAASGVSYGGYAVGMMLAKSGEESNSKIRCGIAVSPVVEWRYYGTLVLWLFSMKQWYSWSRFGLIH